MKRIIAFLLVLVMLFTLSCCGQNNTADNSAKDNQKEIAGGPDTSLRNRAETEVIAYVKTYCLVLYGATSNFVKVKVSHVGLTGAGTRPFEGSVTIVPKDSLDIYEATFKGKIILYKDGSYEMESFEMSKPKVKN